MCMQRLKKGKRRQKRRFHSLVVSTMRQVHRGLRYVLLNARKHGIRIPFGEPDPFSSGPWFEFWKGRRPSFATSYLSRHRGSRSWSSWCVRTCPWA